MEILAKIQLGKWTISTAARLRRKIIDARSKGHPKDELYHRLIGIYDTRRFGIVFYRNGDYDF